MPLGSKPAYLKRKRRRPNTHDPFPDINFIQVSRETPRPIGFNIRSTVTPITLAR